MIDFHVCTLEAASSACVLYHDPKAADTQLLFAFYGRYVCYRAVTRETVT